jgi:hypothetical protein
MGLSIAKNNSDELRLKVTEVVSKLNVQNPEVLETIIVYILSNNLDFKSYFFESQYASLGTPISKIKQIIISSVDFIFITLKHDDFAYMNFGTLENDLKNEIFTFFEQKLGNNSITPENYQEFIDYFINSYNPEFILALLKSRIIHSKEVFTELKAILEYMTFLGRNYIKEQELGRLEKAMNFRLNILKNYNLGYFFKHFFILENQAKIYPKDLQTGRYFYPIILFKDMKNLVLQLDRDREHSHHVQHEGKDLISRQLQLLKQNQETLSRLRDSTP